MASFGARLKQEREQRGITLDDISLSTKIGTRMLRALEEEHFDQLPGGIFNKGFIRAYARTLGMDEEQVIADYLAATGVPPPGQMPESPLINHDASPVPELRAQLLRTQEESPSVSSFPWGRLAVALMFVALGFAAWAVHSRQLQKGSPHSEAPAAGAANLSPARLADQSPLPQPPPRPLQSVAIAPKPNETKVATIARGESSPTPPISTPASILKPLQAAAPANGRFVVSIKAREDCWISITIDGEVTTQRTLLASSQKTVAAHDELVIRAGNVGALDFEFNSKPLSSQGAVGEAKTLTFDAHGLQSTPAPVPAPATLP